MKIQIVPASKLQDAWRQRRPFVPKGSRLEKLAAVWPNFALTHLGPSRDGEPAYWHLEMWGQPGFTLKASSLTELLDNALAKAAEWRTYMDGP